MYGTAGSLTEPPEPNQCNKCDSQQIHLANSMDAFGSQSPNEGFYFAESKYRLFWQSKRQKQGQQAKKLSIKTNDTSDQSQSFSIRRNMLRLCASKHVQKQGLVNSKAGQLRNAQYSMKKVLSGKRIGQRFLYRKQ